MGSQRVGHNLVIELPASSKASLLTSGGGEGRCNIYCRMPSKGLPPWSNVQCTSNAGHLGSIPGQGTRSQVLQLILSTAKLINKYLASPVAQQVKNPPAMPETQETWVQSLGREDPLEKEILTHSSVLVWKFSRIDLAGYSPKCRKESDTSDQIHKESRVARDQDTQTPQWVSVKHFWMPGEGGVGGGWLQGMWSACAQFCDWFFVR